MSNRPWLTDITAHTRGEGKLYRAIKDAFSGRIDGYSIDASERRGRIYASRSSLGSSAHNRRRRQARLGR
ncbi:hypothetical protein GCM10027061_17160 [Nesterenkonia suensis]